MALESYFSTFYIQRFEEIPDGFGGCSKLWEDGEMIRGLYVQSVSRGERDSDSERLVSRGVFITNRDTPLALGNILRSEKGEFYLKINGIPDCSPEFALSTLQRISAELIEVPE